jgi:anti-sigma regulatory factor (Ser/Thr protein kinase)
MQPYTVPGTLDSLKPIADYVLAAAKEAGLDKKASYNLRLAVDEIATNIIMYGYEQAGIEGTVDLQADLDDRALTIVVEDTAAAFNPFDKLAQEEMTVDLPIDQKPMGGLGVYLTIQGVDKFMYERLEHRNRNIFIVNRPDR